MNHDVLFDRVAGGLLGVHAGDSFGAGFEFRSWADINSEHPPGQRLTDITGGGVFRWPAGAATDDTELTKAVLDAYLHPDGFTLARAAEFMLDWYDTDPVDIGNATRVGLDRYRVTRDPADAGAGRGALGNGSLMRCLPTGLCRRQSPTVRQHETAAISAITHNDPVCVDACVVYNEIVSCLLDGIDPGDAMIIATWMGGLHTTEVLDAVRVGHELDVHDMAVNGPPDDLPWDPTSGHVLLSFAFAVAAVLDARPYRDVIIDVVHIGGDTDTNAAVAGGLLGVRDGLTSLPGEWVDVLQYKQVFLRAATSIVSERRPIN